MGLLDRLLGSAGEDKAGAVRPDGQTDGLGQVLPAGPVLRSFAAQEKLKLIEGYEAGSLGLREFCASSGVSTTSFCRWLKQYRDMGAAGLEPAENARNLGGRHRGPHNPDDRRHAVEAFLKSGLSVDEFSRVWGVSWKSLATWVKRYQAQGPQGLENRYLRKRKKRVAESLQEEVRNLKRGNPGFGLKKVRDALYRFGGLKVSTGTVRKILAESGLESPKPKKKRRKWGREPRFFERAKPGELWQTDITSFVLTRNSQRVYLTVFMDDFSRYIVSWKIALQQRSDLVIEALLDGIQRFGKPLEVLSDQGRQYFAWRGKSEFEQILKREGIKHVVARTHHPQTLGKCERFWETVRTEFWDRVQPQELEDCRQRFAHFVAHFNHSRPHQGIDGMLPADRFFNLESQIRKILEDQLAKNELHLALGEPPRKPVFLLGQIGDQKVSLVGEKGSLVVQSPDGSSQHLNYDQLGLAPADKGADNGNNSGTWAESPPAQNPQSPSEHPSSREGSVAGGLGGAKAESAQDGRGAFGNLAWDAQPQSRGPGIGDSPREDVAVGPAGGSGHGGGSFDPAQDPSQRGGQDDLEPGRGSQETQKENPDPREPGQYPQGTGGSPQGTPRQQGGGESRSPGEQEAPKCRETKAEESSATARD